MKSAKDYWDEWSIPEVHGSPPNGWNNLIEAIRDEMREECAAVVKDQLHSDMACYPDDLVTAIRNAGKSPRFKPGQLVRWKSGHLGMWPHGNYNARGAVEPVLDIHGQPVYLPVEGAKS